MDWSVQAVPEPTGEKGKMAESLIAKDLDNYRGSATPRVNDRICRMNTRQSLRHPKFIALIEDKAARQGLGAIAIEAYVSVGNTDQKPWN